MALPSALTSPPPPVKDVVVSFPIPHVLLITLNRPAQLNAIPRAQHGALFSLYEWYDAQPYLRVAVLTGNGRAFCAGADLKEWNGDNQDRAASSPSTSSPPGQPASGKEASASVSERFPAGGGFGGLSNRHGKKPVIAAVNGLCLGGGFEMAINADLIYASESAKFGLPEVMRGVVAIAGALPRLVGTVGRQRASEMAMIGGTYTPKQMENWGVVNEVVGGGAEALMDYVLRVAERIAGNSPDSIIVTREGIMSGLAAEGPQDATWRVQRGIYTKLDGGENMKEGVVSFVEKRKPVWKDSKL